MYTLVFANILFDFPAGWFAYYVGGHILVLLLLLIIILLEAAVLRWQGIIPWRKAVIASLIMNVVSTVLGYVTAMFINPPRLLDSTNYYDGTEAFVMRGLFTGTAVLPGIPIVFLFLWISFVISLLSEGITLLLLDTQRPWQKIITMTLSANGASYLLLLLVCWPPMVTALIIHAFWLVFYWPVLVLFIALTLMLGNRHLRQYITNQKWRLFLLGVIGGFAWGCLSEILDSSIGYFGANGLLRLVHILLVFPAQIWQVLQRSLHFYVDSSLETAVSGTIGMALTLLGVAFYWWWQSYRKSVLTNSWTKP